MLLFRLDPSLLPSTDMCADYMIPHLIAVSVKRKELHGNHFEIRNVRAQTGTGFGKITNTRKFVIHLKEEYHEHTYYIRIELEFSDAKFVQNILPCFDVCD